MIKSRRIFITGGTGFVGKPLVKLLEKSGYRLLLLSRSPQKFRGFFDARETRLVRGNLGNFKTWPKIVSKFKPDIAIHLAWEGIPDFSPATCIKNLKHGVDLYELLGNIGCKTIITTGSCWEYGADRGRLEESSELKPPSHVPAFVIAKRAVQAFGEQIALENKMQFLWLRLFFAYGPGQKARALIPSLVRSFESGIVPEVKNKVGGNDFIYIEDVAEAIVKIFEKSKKQCAIYNIGSGHLTSVARLANITAKNFKHPPFMKEPKKPKGFYADISRIRREIGWRPKTSIEEGIKRTIDKTRNNQI